MYRQWVVPLLLIVAPCARGQEQIFGPTKVHEFQLELSAKEWERMQKVAGGPGLFAKKKAVAKDDELPFEWHKSPGFGFEFPWAHADLTADGKTYKNVGIRYKGNGSYSFSGESLKRNLKIELDHYDKKQRFHGLATITLNAGAVDASRLREALGYGVFRAAGVPAPRTAFAKVTLTIPGKYDKEYVGLYTFVEHVNKAFLTTHFKDNAGLLMKPERLRGIDYPGDIWAKYKDRYLPKREPTKAEAERIIAFAKLVNKADDATFAKEVGAYLDIDNFFRFIAVNAMLPNTDNFMTTGHNFYIYLHPKTGQLSFMPWDLDISFAGFPMMGNVEFQTNLDLLKPAGGKLKLIDRLFAIPERHAQYRQVVRDVATKAFTRERLLAEIDVMEKVTREALAAEAKVREARKEKGDKFSTWVTGLFDPQPPIRTFVEKRAASVGKQVEAMKK